MILPLSACAVNGGGSWPGGKMGESAALYRGASSRTASSSSARTGCSAASSAPSLAASTGGMCTDAAGSGGSAGFPPARSSMRSAAATWHSMCSRPRCFLALSAPRSRRLAALSSMATRAKRAEEKEGEKASYNVIASNLKAHMARHSSTRTRFLSSCYANWRNTALVCSYSPPVLAVGVATAPTAATMASSRCMAVSAPTKKTNGLPAVTQFCVTAGPKLIERGRN